MPRVQSKRWVFTLNNPTPQDEISLRLLAESCEYLVFGRELAPTTGTPHLQGFVVFPSNKSITAARASFPRCFVQIARATSLEAATYCKKDGDFEEFGRVPNTPGRTNRYEDFRDWVVSHGTRPTMAEVAIAFPSIFLNSGRVQSFIDLVFPTQRDVVGEYRPYQASLRDDLDVANPCSRKIVFVVDPVGNAGKSWFVDRYASTNTERVQILSVGRREDLSFAVDERKSVFLFDLPRSSSEFLPYTLLEQLKDRRVFSNKYESRMKTFPHPVHVVVFTNEYPDMTKLSADRYRIIEWSNAVITDN
jgi:hypothetical protein